MLGVAAYLPLTQHLEATTYGLELASLARIETLDGLAMRYAEFILAAGIDGTLTLLGWSYGAFLAQSCTRIVSRRGKSVDLILIEPVLAADFCATRHTGRKISDQRRDAATDFESAEIIAGA